MPGLIGRLRRSCTPSKAAGQVGVETLLESMIRSSAVREITHGAGEQQEDRAAEVEIILFTREQKRLSRAMACSMRTCSRILAGESATLDSPIGTETCPGYRRVHPSR
jgi:hypothetical protein